MRFREIIDTESATPKSDACSCPDSTGHSPRVHRVMPDCPARQGQFLLRQSSLLPQWPPVANQLFRNSEAWPSRCVGRECGPQLLSQIALLLPPSQSRKTATRLAVHSEHWPAQTLVPLHGAQ